MSAIDVSSAQPRDLTALIQQFKPQHVVVKLYQRIEHIGQDYSRDQIKSAQANGCTVGGYLWLYRDVEPSGAVRDVLALADSCGLKLPVLWLDVESYTDGSIPTLTTIGRALTECDRQGVRGGIYTSASMWARVGGSFEGRPLWLANYNEIADVDSVGLFGGWSRERVWGHQFTSTPIDQSVFRGIATRP